VRRGEKNVAMKITVKLGHEVSVGRCANTEKRESGFKSAVQSAFSRTFY
jgi:hypothetical protein